MSGVTPVALTVAGSDASGGAGIQADLKVFQQFGVYGEAAITLLTVQNTCGVQRVECLPGELVADQIRAVIDDIPPAAAKTGALGNRAIIEAVAELAGQFPFPLVVDPVLVSKNGAPLLASEAVDALKHRLLPHAFLLTPNLEEAALITGLEVRDASSMREAARKLAALGPRAVLVKGGHLQGDAIDILFQEGAWREFRAPRINSRNTHGTGCTFSAAITAALALGCDLEAAIGRAKHYITEAIRTSPALGKGVGPVNHWAG
ncbi:MAG TPA: bifunctional hydroxymethylpyrimidine kinase/phosphomethylpyrimidine kinase [Bryobacteraceae bacterium]|nr:bifunctional hydroxymethylpyrimidine kinase/phosphomethylpyrimidine kinase [Bryobacteraceae bacterium]